MPLEGRVEVRLPVATQVYLIRSGEPHLPDPAVTENVSLHGARIETKRPCQVGEFHSLTPSPGELHLHARVVYCQPLAKSRFGVGLRIHDSFANWWEGLPGKRPVKLVPGNDD